MDFLTTDLSKLDDQTIFDLYGTELGNTQGYGPVGHGRSYVSLGLLRFSVGKSVDVRQPLSAWGLRSSSALELRKKRLEYGEARQAGSEAARRAAKIDGVIAVGLSASAFPKLSLPYPNHDVVTGSANDFELGFHGALKEIPEAARKIEPFDAVVIVASDDNQQQLPDLRKQVQTSFGSVASIQWESGSKRPGNVDHFGFAEDIGQPVVFPDPSKNTATWTSGWKPNAQPNLVLAPISDQYPKEFGSYMAYLKIEQHVDDFNKLATQAAELTKEPLDQVHAWILGRYQTGEPLERKGVEADDFVYRVPSPCPVAAHIRKMNNRDQASFRVVRRGVFYEENGSKGALFQCFQSKLEYGFITLWGWAFDRNIHYAGAGQDPFLGERDWPPVPYNVPAPQGVASVRRLTTVQHGGFFYFPSIPFFRRLSGQATS